MMIKEKFKVGSHRLGGGSTSWRLYWSWTTHTVVVLSCTTSQVSGSIHYNRLPNDIEFSLDLHHYVHMTVLTEIVMPHCLDFSTARHQ